MRSELTAGPPFPHLIATRRRQACGTLTFTSTPFARTAKPAFSQYGQDWPEVLTTCAVYAGGTEMAPSTRR